jgi:hypothetical protein
MPQSSKPDRRQGGWTVDTYATHTEALRQADIRFGDERDRRYTEVNIEKEKALKIKETADLAALQLARESQSLKELQNDALRDKTLSESGIYATNAGVTQAIGDLKTSLQPLVDYVSTHKGAELTKGNLYAGAAGIAAFLGALYYIVGR